MKGIFKPINYKKYKGDPTKIIYRSSWELKVMSSLDSDPTVLEWSSEEIVVPYRSPKDGRIHRYFVDFFVRKKDGCYLLEVKPLNQCVPPKISSRKTKRYVNEVLTYGINQSKWKAAKEYCADRGWRFQVLTEVDLNIVSKYSKK